MKSVAVIFRCVFLNWYWSFTPNPVISQWAVFAIRNILEHNPENQKLVQGLRKQGVADDSVLREMGFRVEERDGSLLLRPLKKEEEPGER